MSLTENSNQLFLPGGCNRTQNLRFGLYTNSCEVNFNARNVSIFANLAERFLYVIAKMKFILEENVWNEIILNLCLIKE